jgi:hypothetical protein
MFGGYSDLIFPCFKDTRAVIWAYFSKIVITL